MNTQPIRLRTGTILLCFAALGWPLLLAGEAARVLWLSLWTAYALAIVAVGTLATLRFRSIRVGALAMVGVVAVHVTYGLAVVRALLRGPAG